MKSAILLLTLLLSVGLCTREDSDLNIVSSKNSSLAWQIGGIEWIDENRIAFIAYDSGDYGSSGLHLFAIDLAGDPRITRIQEDVDNASSCLRLDGIFVYQVERDSGDAVWVGRSVENFDAEISVPQGWPSACDRPDVNKIDPAQGSINPSDGAYIFGASGRAFLDLVGRNDRRRGIYKIWIFDGSNWYGQSIDWPDRFREGELRAPDRSLKGVVPHGGGALGIITAGLYPPELKKDETGTRLLYPVTRLTEDLKVEVEYYLIPDSFPDDVELDAVLYRDGLLLSAAHLGGTKEMPYEGYWAIEKGGTTQQVLRGRSYAPYSMIDPNGCRILANLKGSAVGSAGRPLDVVLVDLCTEQGTSVDNN